MPDGVIGVLQSAAPDRLVDNVTVTNESGQTAYRQKVLTYDPIAYYASASGGRVAFGTTTDYLTISGSVEVGLAVFVNPSGSGVDAYIDLGEFGSSIDSSFRRYRGSTITGLGTPRPVANMGGGANDSACKMYVPGQFSASGGTVGKVAYMRQSTNYQTRLGGRTILRPGQGIYWSIDGKGQNYTAMVYLEWWEVAAVA